MQKFFKIIMLTLLTVTAAGSVSAQVKNITVNTEAVDKIKVVGFLDYPPVGYIERIPYPNTENAYHDEYRTVFEEIMNEFAKTTGKKIEYIYETKLPYDELIRRVRGGRYDLVLGVYHETKLYDGLDIVFPSLINNPISIIMLPQNAGKIKSLSQLKNMKGAISTREHLSDYVSEQLKNYNPEYIDEPEQMFEKLYTGEIDYVFASYFFGIVETAKLGLRDKLSFSKQVIWNMPLFFGISKMSPSRNYLIGKLTSYSEKPENKVKLENKLKDMIMQFELQNRGVIPPAYSLKEE